MQKQEFNFLFVSAPFSGIEVFMKNVNHINRENLHIESSWIWLDMKLNLPGLMGMILDFVNWTIKASFFTYLRIRELERSGKVFDAAFYNHVSPLMFLLNFRRRMPTILSLDATPVLMDQYFGVYRNYAKPKLPQYISKYRYRFTKNTYIDATFILAWSELVKRSLIEDYHIPEEKIAVIPPGVDIERFVPEDRRTRHHRQKLKVLFVGGEFKRKGGDIVLKLAHEQRFQNHEFHFVTKTFDGERGPNIFVYDDVSPESDLLRTLYGDADIFAFPTRGDFCPTNTICEAMAMGLPVISTSVGGLDEIVINGDTGCIIGVDKIEQLAEVILKLSEDKEMRFRLGSNARKLIEEKYNLSKNCKKIFSYMTIAANEGRQSIISDKRYGKIKIYD